MRHFLLILFILIFAGISYYLSNDEILTSAGNNNINETDYKSGILKAEYQRVPEIASYIINAELLPEIKKVRVEEKLIWRNKTSYSADKISLHLYPNAFLNNKTLFARGRGEHITEKTRSGIFFSEIKARNKPAILKITHTDSDEINDSTSAVIELEKPVSPGDSILLEFKYELPVPKAMKRFGYAAGRNFFFISQWFPKAGVFENGSWICNQYHPFTNFFADFGSYDVNITVPADYKVAATGSLVKSSVKDGKACFSFSQYGVHDFAWMASDKIEQHNYLYKRKNGTSVIIQAFIQPENEKYRGRFVNAVKNALEYLEKNIGEYPYRTITIVDVPKSSRSGGMEYPTLITVGAELFSPGMTLQPESVTIHEFTHQFFYGIVANNEVAEAWLDEGITSYLASRIAYKYYGQALVSFKLFGYYPVFGLNILSYNEIPLIYTLNDYPVPQGTYALMRYLQAPDCAAIADTSWLHSEAVTYAITGYSKPELMLYTLEKYIGEKNILASLKLFFESNRFSHPKAADFIEAINRNKGNNNDLNWFFRSFYKNAWVYDYSVEYVRPAGNPYEYEVSVKRLRDGIARMDVALYTDKDTLYQHWNGEGRGKKFIFVTPHKVLGAEIDPFRKNIMDINYSNNSYMIDNQYAGIAGIILRWMFWIQNLFLILGSAA